ncbi:3-dehydroquinate synthase II [Symbioplanes lichenis]|uniref:3-dehydroquinate synthase II n=1 Tax=Symbioplanes lichenis TaxID=1629072 RepID=UPI002739CB69|nr:3-dehydroquinate synthase II [Actinoplanes lichenis]
MRSTWIDLRKAPADAAGAVCQAALHGRADAVVDGDPGRLGDLPPTVLRVYAGPETEQWRAHPAGITDPAVHNADVLLLPVDSADDLETAHQLQIPVAAFVRVRDQESLTLACASAARMPRTVVEFTDPTKIPLEIVIAAADKSSGELICVVSDAVEAEIVLGVLEKGSEGLLLAPERPAQVLELQAVVADVSPPLKLATLVVESIEHVGLGDRVCIDTCSHFDENEGILIGSFAHGFILCCSETHPLPYMPTRPFRVNAGALHSYVLQGDNRTNYLSELRAGMTVLAANTEGVTRKLVVGRAKLERRPLLQVTANAADGRQVCIAVQDDWHVRLLGPGGTVLNVTELKPGTELLGYVAEDRRHVGYPVDEFCLER